MAQNKIPLTLKASFIAFLAMLIPVYWVHYGPSNFLWYSDIILGLSFLAVMSESRFIASMGAVGGIFLESYWSVNFLSQLLFNYRITSLTDYMFDSSLPLWLRLISLFHVALPPLLIWLVVRLGYHRKAWMAQIVLAWVVLFTTWFLTEPSKNINWVFSYKEIEWATLSPALYLVLEGLLFAVIITLTNQILDPYRLFRRIWFRKQKKQQTS